MKEPQIRLKKAVGRLQAQARRRHFCVALPSLVAVALLFATLGAVSPHAIEAAPTAQAPVDPPSARQGHAIYQENCAPCHGSQGLGDGPTAAQLPDGATALADPDVARQATPLSWFEVIKEGRMDRFMPPWSNRLSDEEIWDVVAFAMTLHSSTEELQQGEVVWAEHCAACHGDLGQGDGVQAITNGYQVPDLSNPDLSAGRSFADWFALTSAGQGNMPAFGQTLPEEDIWAALTYARTFSYLPVVAAALPRGDGRLVGSVANGTPGGGDVSGLTVNLLSFRGLDELRPREASVDTDGSFVFEGLPTDENYIYLVTVDYKGIPFASEIASFQPGVSEINAPVSVWETSSDPGEITVNLAQWFVEFHQGALLIGELYRISHESDRVFTGDQQIAPGKQAVLQFEVPAEATALALDGGEIGERYILTPDGVADTQPLPPGQVQVLMRYLLPYSGTRAELEHAVPYPIDQLSVLVAEGATVSSSELTEAGTRQVGDRTFVSFEAASIPADKDIDVKLRGLARAAADSSASATGNNSMAVLAYHPALVFGFAVLAAVVVVGLVALPMVRSSRRTSSVSVNRGDATALAERRQALLGSIAELDDRYAAGEVDEATYHESRTAQKRQLLLLTRELEGLDAAGAQAGDQAGKEHGET